MSGLLMNQTQALQKRMRRCERKKRRHQHRHDGPPSVHAPKDALRVKFVQKNFPRGGVICQALSSYQPDPSEYVWLFARALTELSKQRMVIAGLDGSPSLVA